MSKPGWAGSHVKCQNPGGPGHMSKTRVGRVTCHMSHVKRHSHTLPHAILGVPRDLIAET